LLLKSFGKREAPIESLRLADCSMQIRKKKRDHHSPLWKKWYAY